MDINALTSGILLLDKSAGMSSNAALQRVRRLLGRIKAGHVGSLDPLATGMLPVCLGEATKVAGDILDGRKLYRFTVSLGSRTATGDREGEVIETAAVPEFDGVTLEQVLQRHEGRQQQVPPMYSALKRDGQPLYKLARAGIEVQRPAREIEIYRMACLARYTSSLELEVLCSKGTYVRTLAEDIARALGTCGHVSALRRIYVEPFDAGAMETLESIEQAIAAGQCPRVLPPDAPLQHIPAVHLDEAAAVRLSRGQSVPAHAAPGQGGVSAGAAGRVRLYNPLGTFMGMGERDGAGFVHPRRLFN